jgi:H+/Cl- antiporter ClcA
MLRSSFRLVLWLALACCAVADGVLGEAAISGAGDVFRVDEHGHWVFPAGQPELWAPIVLLVALQGVLVFALLRTRRPEARTAIPFSGKTNGQGA